MADDDYDPACLSVLEGMDAPKRDPDDPVVRWAAEFLGLPNDTGAPCGVAGSVPEAPGEPSE